MTSGSWHAFTLADALSPRPHSPMIVQGILPCRSLSVWFGAPGELKTNLLLDMGIAVAAGSRWLSPLPGRVGSGITVSQCPVLWVDLDNGEDVMSERIAAFARAYNAPESTPIYWLSFPSPPLRAAKGLAGLVKYAQGISAGVIVIDNLLRVAGVKDENSSEMDTAMSHLRQLAEDTGAAVALVHHRRKDTMGRNGDTLRGHSSIEASIDSGFLIERDGDTVTVTCTKARRKPIATFAALWTFEHELNGETLHAARFYGVSVPDPKAKAEADLKARILATLATGPMNQSELVGATGARKSAVLDALNTLVTEQKVSSQRGPKNARVYELFPVVPSCSGNRSS